MAIKTCRVAVHGLETRSYGDAESVYNLAITYATQHQSGKSTNASDVLTIKIATSD